jgi:hypothetical protein
VIRTAKYLGLTVITLMLMVDSIGQNQMVSMHRLSHLEVERSVSKRDSMVHMGMKPYFENQFNLESVYGHERDDSKYYYHVSTKLFRDHLIDIKGDDYALDGDILIDLSLGYDFSDTSSFQDTSWIFNNTRGFRIQGDIGKKVSFQTMLLENQSRFAAYVNQFADSMGVVPGQGRTKDFKGDGFDYNASHGWVSISPIQQLNLQIGHGKHFIGHGYRSMLLSDNASNYPFLKATGFLLKGKIQYSWLYAGLQSLERLPLGEVPESLFREKSGSFYYLSFIPLPMVEIGLFESVIWERWDSSGTKPLDGKIFIPVIGINTALNGFSSANNVLVGLNLKIKPRDGLALYGQLAVDDPAKERLAYQCGIMVYDFLIRHLHAQLEYNRASKGMYTSPEGIQGFWHMNQSMAHPLGNQFEEVVGLLNYRYNRLLFQGKVNYQVFDSSPGGSVMTNPEEIHLEQVASNWITDFSLGIMVNPKTNLNLTIGWLKRDWSLSHLDHQTDWVYVSLRSSLFNQYYDF